MKVTFRTALKGLQVAALGLFSAAVLAQPAVKRPAFRGGMQACRPAPVASAALMNKLPVEPQQFHAASASALMG